MRFIPTRLHALIDYLAGLTLIALPFLFGKLEGGEMALAGMGLLVVLYSLITDYELGMARFLRIRFHLALDGLVGLTLLLLPTLYPVASPLHGPVYAIGITAVILVLTTKVRASGTAT